MLVHRTNRDSKSLVLSLYFGKLAEVKTQYERLGIAIRPMNQQEFTRFVRDEVVKYTRIAKTAQIEPQ